MVARRLVFCLVIAISTAFAGSARASLQFASDFYLHFSGNTYLAGAATTDRIELRSDNPGIVGGINLTTYGNGAVSSFGGARGGEFRVEAYAANSSYNPFEYQASGQPLTPWVYKTFCIERAVTFSPNSPYYISIDPYALSGANSNTTATGSDGTGLPAGTKYDPLSDATKLLYGLYFEGRLHAEYAAFQYANDASANILQETFWALEDTPSSALSSGAVALKAWAEARALTDHTYDKSVAVMNLWTTYNTTTRKFSGDAQSQLVFIPAEDRIVQELPEPTAIMAWSLLITTGAVWSRFGKVRRRTGV